jgi:endonuclease YncB( thermonuclease family)
MRNVLLLFCLLGFSGAAWAQSASGWEKLESCQYIAGPHSDGDSVETLYQGKKYVFRVYFVDCIEKNPDSRERRAEQARSFGITGPDQETQALRLGRQAATQTRLWLERPFTVYTRWEKVSPGTTNPAFRAFIETADGKDLAGLLVDEGLAIIRRGRSISDHPLGHGGQGIRQDLVRQESQARQQGKGAWGVASHAPAKSAAGVFSATDTEALLHHAGKSVRVRGVIRNVHSLPGRKITFVNFEGVPRGGFVAIVRAGVYDRVSRALPGGLEGLSGKSVEVSGAINLYQDTPQIEIDEAGQLRVIEK